MISVLGTSLMTATITGRLFCEAVNHIQRRLLLRQTRHNPSHWGWAGVIQKGIVLIIDKKLCGCRVWIVWCGPWQGCRVCFSGRCLLRFNCSIGGFLVERGVEAAALRHKTRNYAVKNSASVKALLNIGDKISGGKRCFFVSNWMTTSPRLVVSFTLV